VAERTNLNLSDFAQALVESQKALAELRAGPVAGAPETGTAGDGETEQLTGEGEAAGGRVKARAVTGGRFESIQLDPRALRMDSEELGKQITLAANAALDDLRTKAAEQRPAGLPDLQALSEQMVELQDESVRRMSTFVEGLDDALGKIARSAGTDRE
jgi:DNA-binding protein YbaB